MMDYKKNCESNSKSLKAGLVVEKTKILLLCYPMNKKNGKKKHIPKSQISSCRSRKLPMNVINL